MSSATQLPSSTEPSAEMDITRFHISLNVANLSASVAFFEAFFGLPPAKLRADYAKFEVRQPPLVLSLEPAQHSAGGALNHLGLRLPAAANLGEWQRRLATAGLQVHQLDGVECCYAKQSKIWLHDPDGNLWEVYSLDEDLDHHGGPGSSGDARSAPTLVTNILPPDEIAMEAAPSPSIWAHRMGQPLPGRLFALDSTMDEARLQGTFNLPYQASDRAQLLAEVMRCLKPGGKIHLHILTTDRDMPGPLQLPGPAAAVQYAPQLHELTEALSAAGFIRVELTRYGSAPCFQVGEAELRETMIEAFKPAAAAAATMVRVMYKGPFAELHADNGLVLRRGQWTELDESTWAGLQTSGAADRLVRAECRAGQCGA